MSNWTSAMAIWLAGFGIGSSPDAGADRSVKLENLLPPDLALTPDLGVIVSFVEIATDARLAKHRHPGDQYKMPLQQAHTAFSGARYAIALVFAVHRQGVPERSANWRARSPAPPAIFRALRQALNNLC